ncbi:MAG: diguanylate cyclase [Deltaproteobacteria bacterium]|nr:diguanylate cyclase [Deltaproteobacteria bacterium]
MADTAETYGDAGCERRAVSRDTTHRFLVVTGDGQEVERLARLLVAGPGGEEPELARVADPVQARAAVDDQRFDAVFVDVDGLPPGTIHELEALVAREGFPPILAFTSCSDPEFAARLLELGIDDCLVKGEVDRADLTRSVVLGAARGRMRVRLYAESLTDELTGLYNRRGFLRIGAQFLDGAKRRGCGAWLLFADIRGLKRINDRFGHVAGDRALRAAADLLRGSFRSADVVARLGGDEFTVLAGDASESSRELLVARALGRLDGVRRAAGLDVGFGLAIGTARFRPAEPIPLQELLRIAGEEAAAAKQGARCEG